MQRLALNISFTIRLLNISFLVLLGVLNHLLPDVHIETDHFKGKEGGDSPGYSLSLVAESTSGALLSVERNASSGVSSSQPELPEDLGSEAALQLLLEIHRGNDLQYV